MYVFDTVFYVALIVRLTKSSKAYSYNCGINRKGKAVETWDVWTHIVELNARLIDLDSGRNVLE